MISHITYVPYNLPHTVPLIRGPYMSCPAHLPSPPTLSLWSHPFPILSCLLYSIWLPGIFAMWTNMLIMLPLQGFCISCSLWLAYLFPRAGIKNKFHDHETKWFLRAFLWLWFFNHKKFLHGNIWNWTSSSLEAL